MKKLAVINGFRGLASLMIVFYHLPIFSWFEIKLILFLPYFNTAVNLFFILSGFVLYRHYHINKAEFATTAEVISFYKKRFLRLYPLFIASCLLIWLFYYHAEEEYAWSSVKAISTYSLFFGQDFLPKINWPVWSLMLEIWFSILFPFALMSIKRTSLYKTWLFVVLLSLTCRLLPEYYPSIGRTLFMLSRFDDFFLGMVVCTLYYDKEKMLSPYSNIIFGTGIAIWPFACVWGQTVCNTLLPGLVNNFFQVSYGLILLGGLLSKGWLLRVLSFYPLQVIGIMCFSIYIWQGVFIHLVIHNKFHAIDYLYFTIALSAVATLSYRFLEYWNIKSTKKVLGHFITGIKG